MNENLIYQVNIIFFKDVKITNLLLDLFEKHKVNYVTPLLCKPFPELDIFAVTGFFETEEQKPKFMGEIISMALGLKMMITENNDFLKLLS